MGIAKATIRNLATNRSIEVPFNPEDYSLTSANTFKTQDVPKGRPTVQFTGANLRRLQMDLFVDTSQSQTDVRSQVQPILELLEKDATTDAPRSSFSPGGAFSFDACSRASASGTRTSSLTAVR